MRGYSPSPLVKQFATLVSAPALLCLHVSECFARAGGGGGFSGSSSSGGGGFGGGGFGGGLWLSGSDGFDWEDLVILIILVVVAAAISIARRYLSEHEIWGEIGIPGTRVREDAGLEPAVAQHQSIVSKLADIDPDFDIEQFLERFRNAFRLAQSAWEQQELDSIKLFVSDRILERFRLQLDEQRDLGYRDSIRDLKIHHVHLAESIPSPVFDVLVVRVVASAIDYRVSLQTGDHLSGKKSRDTFVEYWSFVRRHGAGDSQSRGGLIEGSCPNCGDQLSLNQVGQCESCSAVVRNGDYDWILTEITQASVWKRKGYQELSSAAWYRDLHDPGFHTQHLEDRASVIFWRKAMADRLGEIQPLMKVAVDPFCDQYEKTWKWRNDERLYAGNCSVGGVDLVGVIKRPEMDLALVEIAWSSHVFARKRTGQVTDCGNWTQRRHLFILGRKSGITSEPNRSIVSTQCPNCGAPESDLASHACEFCKEVVNDGSHEWVLLRIERILSEEARKLRQESERQGAKHGGSKLTHSIAPGLRASDERRPSITESLALSRTDGLAWIIKTLVADGRIQETERRLLERLSAKAGISDEAVQGLLTAGMQGTLEAPLPADRFTAKAWLGEMALIALADGEVTREERALLTTIGKHAELSVSDVNLIVAKIRTRLRRRMKRHKE